ncbi:MAG: tail fiber domain-containing protein [Parafilimonas sp.]
MKKNFTIFIIGCLFLAINHTTSFAQNANTSLSNLTAPTKVNVHLLPQKEYKYNLGSFNKAWNNIYAGSVYLGNDRFLAYFAGTSYTTAVGALALNSLTTGNGNTAVGFNTLYFNTKGSSNTANGAFALYKNITGASNTANGYEALYFNTSGSYNTANGINALYRNTTGTLNTVNGSFALYENTTGSNNTANGSYNLFSNTTGVNNTADGYYNLFSNTTGSKNISAGNEALRSNKTGNENTAAGYRAGYSNVSSNYNVMIGSYAGYKNTAAQNTFVGTSAGRDFTLGNYNTCLGINAGYGGGAAKTGNYNTYIGGYTNAAASIINATAIGYAAYVGSDYTVRIGDGSITSIGGYTNWSNISDGRVKKNIKQNVPGLSFINKLQPVTYNLDLDAADRIIQRPAIKDEDGKTVQPLSAEITARLDKEKIIYSGFVAQDVEKIAKELNYNFSGVDAAKNDKDLYGLRYSEFVVPLVKAVQELSKKNDEKDNVIEDLKTRLAKLEAMMNVNSQSTANNQKASVISSALLEQNIPNPFNNTTTINYILPQKYNSAQIIITDKTGKALKQINVSGSGKGSLKLNASTLSSGAYHYTLIVDGKMIDSKQMERLK